MANAFSRSWEITKLSLDIMKKDKELLLFPILGGIFSVLFIIAMLFPAILAVFIPKNKGMSGALLYLAIFIIYLGLSFIATFFNVCVVYTTKTRLAGKNATFGESIGFAFSKIHLVLAWSLVAASVGLILRILDSIADRMGRGGQILMNIMTSILGMVWSVITVFVVPSMVYHDCGPFDAIKRSIAAIKKTWGESLIRYYGLGLIEAVLIILGVIAGFILVILTLALGPVFMIFIIALVGVYLVAVVTIFSVANTIFNTALYWYADTGKVPSGYNTEVMRNAFQQKK